jgi:hypothetical protein
MKKTAMVSVLLVLILAILFSVPSFGAMKKLAQVGFKGLIMPIGARAAGMGNAMCSVPTGANSIFWNPAAITDISSDKAFSFNYMSYIADIQHTSGAAVFSLENFGHIGVSFMVLDYGTIDATRRIDVDPGYLKTGEFSPGEIAIGLAYGRKMTDKFSFGGHIKYARQDLGSGLEGDDFATPKSVDFKLSTFAFDFGTLYYTGIRDLRVAMSFQNFSKEVKYQREEFPLPLMFRIGVAMNVLSIFQEENPNQLLVSLDFQHPRDFPERMHAGAEYLYNNPRLRDMGINNLALRGGWKFGYDEESWAFGFGLSAFGAKIDYAVQEFGIFDNVSTWSVTLDL